LWFYHSLMSHAINWDSTPREMILMKKNKSSRAEGIKESRRGKSFSLFSWPSSVIIGEGDDVCPRLSLCVLILQILGSLSWMHVTSLPESREWRRIKASRKGP
jgi:hypothetical protein